ncbi:MAG TPA: hypothetical protein VMM14_01015 [Acidimicrobiia bacterium]|nr:hypothetical protein [Acidimicrobiia bacterium]
MSSIVDSEALNRFLVHADVYEARRVAAALDAMASAAHLAAVELETRSEQGGGWVFSSATRRPHRKQAP